jgi:hypothetical protein
MEGKEERKEGKEVDGWREGRKEERMGGVKWRKEVEDGSRGQKGERRGGKEVREEVEGGKREGGDGRLPSFLPYFLSLPPSFLPFHCSLPSLV